MDVNSPYLSRRLMSLGLEVKKITSVGDSEASLAEVIDDAKEKNGIIIVSGGLGLTFDGITKKVVSRVLGRSLILNQKVLEEVNGFLRERGIEPTPNYERLALFPLKAEPVPNPKGIAWGFYLRYKSAHFFFLPGVPSELIEMVEAGVIPIIEREFRLSGIVPRCLLKVFGLTESEVEKKIKDVLKEDLGVRFSIRVSFPEIHLEISARDGSKRDQGILTQCVDRVVNRLVPYVIGRDSETIEFVVGECLERNGLTLFVAESCTGGLLGHRITTVPGSSTYFLGGIAAYNNKIKEKTLNVSSIILKKFGAVSRETAVEMAKGAKHLGNADIGLAITGIAGPGGGSEEKPVGTVFIALFNGTRVRSERFRFFGDREEVKTLSSYWALEMLRRYLISGGGGEGQGLHSH